MLLHPRLADFLDDFFQCRHVIDVFQLQKGFLARLLADVQVLAQGRQMEVIVDLILVNAGQDAFDLVAFCLVKSQLVDTLAVVRIVGLDIGGPRQALVVQDQQLVVGSIGHVGLNPPNASLLACFFKGQGRVFRIPGAVAPVGDESDWSLG